MNVMVAVPEQFVARFGSEARLERHVLEVLAWEEYQAGRMTQDEFRDVLGLADETALHGFLKERGFALPTANVDEAVPGLVERFRAFRAGKTLGGVRIEDLIAEGRR